MHSCKKFKHCFSPTLVYLHTLYGMALQVGILGSGDVVELCFPIGRGSKIRHQWIFVLLFVSSFGSVALRDLEAVMMLFLPVGLGSQKDTLSWVADVAS